MRSGDAELCDQPFDLTQLTLAGAPRAGSDQRRFGGYCRRDRAGFSPHEVDAPADRLPGHSRAVEDQGHAAQAEDQGGDEDQHSTECHVILEREMHDPFPRLLQTVVTLRIMRPIVTKPITRLPTAAAMMTLPRESEISGWR